MTVDISVNQELLEKALKLGGFSDQNQAVTVALESFIKSKETIENKPSELADIMDLSGSIDYFDDYDYKASRNRETAS